MTFYYVDCGLSLTWDAYTNSKLLNHNNNINETDMNFVNKTNDRTLTSLMTQI